VRLALAVEDENVIVTFQNILVDCDMYLPLGRAVGLGRAEFVEMQLVLGDGTRKQVQYIGGSGVAPGRILPYIVPMMPGSIYSVKTQLRFWRIGADSREIVADLNRGAGLQAIIEVPSSIQEQYVLCYGLQIFWSGRAASKIFHGSVRVR
jgi:hypothetical protein